MVGGMAGGTEMREAVLAAPYDPGEQGDLLHSAAPPRKEVVSGTELCHVTGVIFIT
jgi:hypothetical protein